MIIKNDFVDKMVNANFLFIDYNITHMKKCQCTKCQSPNEIKEFGHRYADIPNSNGVYESEPIIPGSNRFFVLACFITLSKRGDLNQLDEIQ